MAQGTAFVRAGDPIGWRGVFNMSLSRGTGTAMTIDWVCLGEIAFGKSHWKGVGWVPEKTQDATLAPG